MQLKRTFKYRLYPSKIQQNTINQQLETARWLYNELLGIKIETYNHTGNSISKYDLNKDITYLKPYIRNDNLHSQVKQNISDRIDKAFKNMFYRKKRGEKGGFPRYKGKYAYKTLTYPQSGFKLNKKLYVSKVGNINIIQHRELQGTIKNMSIKKTKTNKYYAVFSCIVDIETKKRPNNKTIGIDVGLKHFLTTDKGIKIDSPKYYRKAEEKLAFLQREHAKKKKGSKNRNKSRIKVAILHETIANQRLDFLHKISYQITNNYGCIAIEDLNIKGMVRNHCLAKSITDAGWSIFIDQLHYKAENAGIVVTEANRFYPSTKLCNKCGMKQDMPLHKRTFKCKHCGYIGDRDTNSAINLKNNSIGTMRINACGDGRVLPSMNQEATVFKRW